MSKRNEAFVNFVEMIKLKFQFPKAAFCAIAILLLATAGCKRHQQFDRQKWSYGDDIDYPQRNNILDDLLKNHKLKGLTHYQVIQLLGAPQDIKGLKYTYQIVNTDHLYSSKEIKPVYVKNLILYFSKDSIVTKTEVYEHSSKKKQTPKF